MRVLRLSIRLLFTLAFLGAFGLLIYALIADLPASVQSVVVEIPLPSEQ